jgi:pimeloyl-ACP methyl ester carboxylesterase
MFATFFTKLSPMLKDSNPMPRTDEKPDVSGEHNKLTEHPTLAIYGDKDVFTSPRKLRRWAEQLANVNDSRFTFAEITGAGHFWHENRAEARMKDAIRYWVEDLVTA